MIVNGQQNNMKLFARLPAKTKLPTERKITWNQVCVLVKHELWQFFFSKIVLKMDIVRAYCYEEDLQFSEEIWAHWQSSYLQGEN